MLLGKHFGTQDWFNNQEWKVFESHNFRFARENKFSYIQLSERVQKIMFSLICNQIVNL